MTKPGRTKLEKLPCGTIVTPIPDLQSTLYFAPSDSTVFIYSASEEKYSIDLRFWGYHSSRNDTASGTWMIPALVLSDDLMAPIAYKEVERYLRKFKPLLKAVAVEAIKVVWADMITYFGGWAWAKSYVRVDPGRLLAIVKEGRKNDKA